MPLQPQSDPAPMPKDPSQSPPSRLLALPAELRDQIWDLTIEQDSIFEIRARRRSQFSYCGRQKADAPPPWKPAIYPALTHTCRQTRSEILPLFYERTIFDAPHHLILQFFGTIGRENVELLTRVRHSQHVGAGSWAAVASTLNILSRAYETLGLRATALEFPVFVEGVDGLSWINMAMARQLMPIGPGQFGLSLPPVVAWKDAPGPDVQECRRCCQDFAANMAWCRMCGPGGAGSREQRREYKIGSGKGGERWFGDYGRPGPGRVHWRMEGKEDTT